MGADRMDGMRPARTLRWKLSLLAAGYGGSLCANLVLSTICILAYLKPAYREAWQDLQTQQRVEQIRALLRSESYLLRNGTIDGKALSDLEARIQAEAAAIEQLMAGGDSARAWLPVKQALAAWGRRDATGPEAVHGNHQELDGLLNGLSGLLAQQRYNHLARAANVQQWVIAILLTSTLVGATLCIVGLVLLRRWVIGPVSDLRTATGQIGRGNLQYQVTPRYSDELGRLGEELNQMSARLLELQGQLLEQERLAAASETLTRLQEKLRAPLEEIRGLAGSILRDAGADQDLADCQQRILATVDRFENWLNLLRDSLSPQSLRREPVRPCDLLDDVVKALRPLLDRTGVDVRVRVDPGLELIRVDRLHFPQAIVALVTNAVEASSAGQVVHIEAGPSDVKGRWCLSVADAGPGIPAELQARIFQPFFTTKIQGNGIGLAMALKVVKLHGGTLEVESKQDQGSRFTATIPEA